MIELTLAGNSSSDHIKTCCAHLYESDWAKLLLGSSFHPGGLNLTARLGKLIGLQPGQRLLDVASGPGTSAIFLAEQFGCEVVGVDYGHAAITQATQAAQEAGLSHLVTFQRGDAESLPFADNQFDALICECAFCTFPDKATAVTEFVRVLKPGGLLGLSDLTRSGPVPPQLANLLAWIACIADAQPLEQIVTYLQAGGLQMQHIERHDEALIDLVQQVRMKLVGAELLLKFKKIALPAADFEQAKRIARQAETAVKGGTLGYSLLTAARVN